MKRRDFLKSNAMAAYGLMLSAARFPINNRNPQKVIIIGAGAAGAMAAHTLNKHGHEVQVLEARNRIGGRIHTNRDWMQPIELGANWISYASHPDNLGWKYKQPSGIETAKTAYSNVSVFDKVGKRMGALGVGLTGFQISNRTIVFYKTRAKHLPDLSWDESVDLVMDYKNLSTRKQDQIDIIKLANAASVGIDNELASGRAYSSYDPGLVEDEQLVINGYDQLIHHLLSGISVTLNQKVLELEDLGGRVLVKTQHETFEGDYVLLTVPISLLQKGAINIIPKLPESKKEAFNKMQMGLFNKAVMRFSRKFWRGDPHFFAFQKEVLKNSGVVFNYHAYTDIPILIAFHVGKQGKWLEEVEEDEVKQHWQEVFHKAFPRKEIEFEAFMRSSWHGDPYTLGSYSYIPIGTKKEDIMKIAEPHGRIHFAGEATSRDWHGYVHGALETGLREANRIMKAI